MLLEDEYVVDSAFVPAGEALLLYLEANLASNWQKDSASSCKNELRRMLRQCKHETITREKSLIFCFELTRNLPCTSDPTLTKIKDVCLWMYETHFGRDDAIAVISGDKVIRALGSEVQCRSSEFERCLEAAIANSSENILSHPLVTAAEMLIESGTKLKGDSFLIFLTDAKLSGVSTLDSATQLLQQVRERANTNQRIHTIVLGIELHNIEAGEYAKLCSASSLSLYIDCTHRTVNEVVVQMGSLFSKRSASNTIRQALTMEKF